MNLNLANQTALVFGSARGIGRAIARAFAAEGCNVISVDLRKPNDPDANITDVEADVTKYETVQSLAETLGPVDHLVFAVGIGSGVPAFPFWNQQPSDWARVLDVNLMGAVNVAHAFAPGMAERSHGSLLFLASVAAQIGSQTDPPYSAAKAALVNFMQCIAKDVAPHGVRCNALSPGMVKTELNKSVWEANQQLLPDEQRQSYEEWTDEKIKKISPLGRWQTAEECAAMAVFLASEQAKNITGQTLNVDGGQVMHS